MCASKKVLLFFVLAAIFAAARPAVAQTQNELASRGKYIFTAIQGCACHTPRNPDGSENMSLYLAGAPLNPPHVGHPASAGWTTPKWKKLYARNITPDPETGIGKWTESDFIKTIKTGKDPAGRILDPVMPWHSFLALTDTDLKAIWAYLRTVKPVKNKNPEDIPSGK